MVQDVDGNRYLDFAAGIAVVATGHCHPDVVAAIRAQSERFLHMCATDFFYENVVELAEGLARRAPGPGPWRAFFANSGAEVVEAAVKLARMRTGRQKIVAFYGAFHGRTYGALDLDREQAGPAARLRAPPAGGAPHPLRVLLSLPGQPPARDLQRRVPGPAHRDHVLDHHRSRARSRR